MSEGTSRRTFLRGALGFTLALPFLPSVAPKSAKAAPSSNTRKRFVAFATDHGGIWQSNMYPGDATLVDSSTYAGRTIRRGDIALETSGSVAKISSVFSGASSLLTPALAAKMNVLRGLDVTFYMGHNRGGHLGNYADNDGNLNGEQGLAHMPTIDQVMAWSTSFYGSLGSIKERSLVIGSDRMSWGYSNPSTHSGQVQAISSQFDSLALFNEIFVPPDDGTVKRAPVVDLVLEDYQRLRNTNRRLSVGDKHRLDDYLDRLAELQRKLEVQASCGDVEPPTESTYDVINAHPSFSLDPAAQTQAYQLFNDVIVAAFTCDTSRIATMRIGDIFSSDPEDWHQGVAHQASVPDGVKQQIIADSYQRVFEGVYLDLVAKLDAVDDVDGTLLDGSLVQWTHECGPNTHTPIELPVVTAGSAGGYLKTGQYADYRDLTRKGDVSNDTSAIDSHIGLVYNQWLGTALQAMGLDPSEYESGEHGGYGAIRMSPDGESWYSGYQKYNDDDLSVMSEPLPFLKA